jgi:hypothetical protein
MANSPYDCPDCGLTHRHGCHGHAKHTSDTRAHLRNPDGPTPCHGYVAPGGTVCRVHGASPNVKAKAARRVTEEKATAIMQKFAGPIETTATQALLDTVNWTFGYVSWLRDIVAEIEPDELVWGLTKTTEGFAVVGNGPTATLEKADTDVLEAKPSVWHQLLAEWHDKLVRVCAEAIKAGIDERKVQLAESNGHLVAGVLKGIFGELMLTPEQMQLVGEVVPRHLRAVGQ